MQLLDNIPVPPWIDPDVTLERSAVVSDDGVHRYMLTRRWAPGPLLPFILLNPSIADSTTDDATVRRCMSFAQHFGCSGIRVGNIFAHRDTDPHILPRLVDPIGLDNPKWIMHLVKVTREEDPFLPVVCGWGVLGGLRGGHERMMRTLRDVNAPTACLGVTKEGYPKHPLYIANGTPLQPYEGTIRLQRTKVSTARILSLMERAGMALPPSTQA